ncbi:MAG: universal stress protein [Nitrospirae bacterium]|nr:universal stress protein [Nitrospirota bacterium]
MVPRPLPTTILRENTSVSRILVAVDDSEHSERALRYVGTLLRDTRDVHVTLFHVLKPMPRELLEHGGSEDPRVEVRLAEELQQDQETWVRTESMIEYPILVKALELFGKTGFPLDRVTLKFGHEDDIAHTILDEARNGGFGTIVVSRHGATGIKRFFGGDITDQLLCNASGFTLWVVE